uniref:DUF2887 domain-containing protein n=1 Tax=Gloeocapsa sp. PCC 7428 TaxID=1173026 RepID=UPI00030D9A02
MRRDSIFYKLFQQSPTLRFELLTNPPVNAEAYRFDSVAVKEPKFKIDGVFLPPDIKVQVWCICVLAKRASGRFNFKKRNGCVNEYLLNSPYISTATAINLVIGKQ